jgi:phospholipid-transporting ATPase
VLYSVIYTAVPTIVVAILDKNLSRRTLLEYPQLYGAGQREENYNLSLFIFIMLDSVWQSLVIFFIPYLAYRKSVIDGASLGDLWTLAVVILVNIHLAMDVIRWNWITHAAIWGSIVATWICVMVIDSIPIMPGFWYARIPYYMDLCHSEYLFSCLWSLWINLHFCGSCYCMTGQSIW